MSANVEILDLDWFELQPIKIKLKIEHPNDKNIFMISAKFYVRCTDYKIFSAGKFARPGTAYLVLEHLS
jgi:hypothetical protein